MTFFASLGKRPVYTSEETRKFAYDSLHHKYGLDTKKIMSLKMDDVAGFSEMTALEKYDQIIERICKEARIRICENEKLSGAATLGRSIEHMLPVTYHGKDCTFDVEVPRGGSSISHLTIDFETVLKKGVNHLIKQAKRSLAQYQGTEKEAFARSCVHCLSCMQLWHGRYLEALKDKPGYEDNYKNLQHVPFEPAQSFYEAVQSLWFTFAFVRLCGNWPGFGRLDYLLGDYLEKDLKAGILTIDEAREILAHFFIKGCEWVCGGVFGSGDAQHYQNIILGGIDENGKEVTNAVTYLVLDILEEFGISDFPTTIRVNRNTDPKLLTRAAEVIRYGGGVVAVYNEELIIDSLVRYGYPEKEARKFANDGCWEVQIPGKTYFSYVAFDALAILQKSTLHTYENVNFFTFDSLYQAFLEDLRKNIIQIGQDKQARFQNWSIPGKDWKWKTSTPCTVVSLFEQSCIEKGLSYLEGGPIYNIISPHIGGLPDVVNSLYAIKKLVFDDQKITFSELMQALKNNWEGYEPLRQYALNRYVYYGNDNDEVDLIAADIVSKFSQMCDALNGISDFRFPAGISTFGRQLEWSPHRYATPYGMKAQAVLSGNYSPTPGTDKEGATAIIRSYCKTDFRNTVSGAALDIKLLPNCVKGENGIDAIVALIKGFVDLGGHFMQLDIADTQLLLDAQEHPENYPTLSVRVSGWNARFITLNKEWQDMIIAQTGSDF